MRRTNRKSSRDNGCFVQRIHHDHTVPLRKKRRRRYHMITDANHFRGVKAARTRTINRTLDRIIRTIHECEGYEEEIRAILEDVL